MNMDAIEMQYLLGKLSDTEAARLEERSFTDDSVFEEIEIAEDELIDAYVTGRLSAEDRKRFENKFLNSKRVAERVQFAKLFSKSASQQLAGNEPVKPHWWERLFNFSFIPDPAFRGAVAAGLLLLVVALPAFVVMRLRDERRLNLERAAIEQQRQVLAQQLLAQEQKTKELGAELQKSRAEETRLQQELQATTEEFARTSKQPAAPASILLYAGSARDPSQRHQLNVPSTASTIRLRLVLDSDDYASYQATIKSPADDVLKRSNLKTNRSGQVRIIVLEFPSRLLSAGEYVVSVSGRAPSGTYERVADYSLRVSKK